MYNTKNSIMVDVLDDCTEVFYPDKETLFKKIRSEVIVLAHVQIYHEHEDSGDIVSWENSQRAVTRAGIRPCVVDMTGGPRISISMTLDEFHAVMLAHWGECDHA